MKRFLLALGLLGVLTGCANLEPNMRDGKEYAGKYPVLYSGTVVDIQFVNKDGENISFAEEAKLAASTDVTSIDNQSSLAKETSNTLSTANASLGNLASMTTGMSAAGGGLVVGLASVFFDIVSNQTAPKPPQIVILKDDGTEVSLDAPPHLLERAIKFHCLDLGERAKVVNEGERYLRIMHEDPRLIRWTILDPSCDALRET